MQKTNGEALVHLLEEHGVDTIFGIPGVHTIELYRGLTQTPIRHVLTRHEQGAAFMADGYARASGKPGVCFLISGPGVMNAMTPIGQAYSDSVPMLVVSTVLARADIGMGRGRLHEMKNQEASVQAVAGWSATAQDGSSLKQLVNRAFQEFATQRPRPISINIPIDILPEPGGVAWEANSISPPVQPSESLLEEAAETLLQAENPVMIVGGGAVDAASEVTALAELLSIPVVTTIAGKGVIAASHPMFAASMMEAESVRTLIDEADIVLAVGTELASPDFWDGDISISGKLIRIDLDPMELSDDYGADLAICADARASIAGLNRLLAGMVLGHAKRDDQRDIARLRADVSKTDNPERAKHRAILESIRRALPEDTILATDMTQIAYSGNAIYPMAEPRLWLHPCGFGTLGYALPAGIGACFAKPGKPVAVLAGDYGFQFTANELGTAAEHKLNLPIFLWNNHALGEIKLGMEDVGVSPIAVEQSNPDFGLMAQAYDCAYDKPSNLLALEEATARALNAGKPTLIEITAAILES